MVGSIPGLLRSNSGAVAPTVALSLFGLIAAGGIAFDYARMASMDTELQNAADQAALAAASQLDAQPGACQRAADAARDMVTNLTLMANDGGTTTVTIASEPECDATGWVRFYQDVGKTQAATNDENAKFVEVEVNPRTAFYALTPVVAAFSSGPLSATAFAGLGEAICNTPPVMICNPQETGTNSEFDVTGLIGVGLRLVSQGGGTGTWAPGNYGYLDTGGGSNGAPGLREGLGWGTPPGDCVAQSGVDTKPGVTTTVTDALNTRFDIYNTNVSCPTGGNCPAAINSVKDVKRPADASGGNSCKMHNAGWNLIDDYLPTSATAPLVSTPTAMGHPRDMCHAVDSSTPGACTGPIGNGLWDRDAYFRVNYVRGDGSRWDNAAWRTNTGLPANATRYQVYAWEIEHRDQTIDGVTILADNPAGASGGTLVAHGKPVCSPLQGYGSGVIPSETTPDRRKISVAVVNCVEQAVSGNSTDVAVVDWIDAFLVEPSLNRQRTRDGDIYIEVIGRTDSATDEGAVQQIKKSVPYLIE